MGGKLLCQVKSAQAPNQPANPTSDEIGNIKSRASQINATACVAKVQFGTFSDVIVKFEKL